MKKREKHLSQQKLIQAICWKERKAGNAAQHLEGTETELESQDHEYLSTLSEDVCYLLVLLFLLLQTDILCFGAGTRDAGGTLLDPDAHQNI